MLHVASAAWVRANLYVRSDLTKLSHFAKMLFGLLATPSLLGPAVPMPSPALMHQAAQQRILVDAAPQSYSVFPTSMLLAKGVGARSAPPPGMRARAVARTARRSRPVRARLAHA